MPKKIRLTRQRPTTEQTLALLDELAQAHDRAAAVIVAAWAEDALEQAIISRFSPLSETDKQELFEGEAPLSRFSAKIRLGYAMGLYHKEMRADLMKVKDIRNDFAHARIPISFAMPEIANRCATLAIISRISLKARRILDIAEMPWPPATAKMQYIVGTRVLTWLLESIAENRDVPPVWPSPSRDK